MRIFNLKIRIEDMEYYVMLKRGMRVYGKLTGVVEKLRCGIRILMEL